MPKIIGVLAIGLISLLLQGCVQVGFVAANTPANLMKIFEPSRVHKNISYGDLPLQKLDIYQPEKSDNLASVLVFYHGGRWQEGTKDQYAFIAQRFAKEGYVVAVPDMRKYPDIKFPAFVEDAAAALSWVHDNIADYQGDPNRIVIAGHSSGAHIGSLVASDPSYLAAYNKERSIINGFAGLAGPYAFTPKAPDLVDLFGPPENFPNMQVPTFIDGTQPPMLLLYGLQDESVGLFNLERLQEAIENKGGDVDAQIYEDIDHVEIIGALSWLLSHKAPVAGHMLEFFERVNNGSD